MLRNLFFAAAAVFALPASAATYTIPSLAGSNASMCPSGVVTAEPGSTISGEAVSAKRSEFVTIRLAPVGGTGQVELGNCVFEISDAFTVAKGAPNGSTLYAAPQGSHLIGIATNVGTNADYLVGGPGDDTLEVVAVSSIIVPGAGHNVIFAPAKRTRKVGRRTIVTDPAKYANPGDTVNRR